MLSKKIDLMRHGEPEQRGIYLGRTDVALSDAGAEAAMQALGPNPGWQLVVSSPLSRCRTTAEHFAEQTGLELLILDQLQEYDFGDWDGQLFEQVYAQQAQKADAFWRDPMASPPPGGETITELSQRLQQAQALLMQRPEQHILVITHAGVIRCMLAQVLGIDVKNWSRVQVDYNHFARLRFDYDAEQSWPALIASNIPHC